MVNKKFHGSFIPWIEENCPFGRVQAHHYQRIYEGRELLNDKCIEPLGINATLRLIRSSERKQLDSSVGGIETYAEDSNNFTLVPKQASLEFASFQNAVHRKIPTVM